MTVPPKPEKPTPPDAPPRGSWLALMLAAGVTFLVIVTLTFLTIGYFGPVLIIAALMAGVVLFHYVVWGWWLEPVLRQAQAEEDAKNNPP
ncbi:MAG TPA: hypothetical protein VL096_17445 [Pirellulaceae bacterium]|nr:hypothetical protein [Pirellulaceae bacterium]